MNPSSNPVAHVLVPLVEIQPSTGYTEQWLKAVRVSVYTCFKFWTRNTATQAENPMFRLFRTRNFSTFTQFYRSYSKLFYIYSRYLRWNLCTYTHHSYIYKYKHGIYLFYFSFMPLDWNIYLYVKYICSFFSRSLLSSFEYPVSKIERERVGTEIERQEKMYFSSAFSFGTILLFIFFFLPESYFILFWLYFESL